MAKTSKMGRPQKPIDWELVNSLLELQCPHQEVCAVLKISDDTLARRCKEDHGMTFAEYSEINRVPGKVAIRRKQYQKALNGDGDNQMLKLLGTNWLGQTDRVEQTGTTTVVNEYAGISTKDLENQVEKLMKKIKAG